MTAKVVHRYTYTIIVRKFDGIRYKFENRTYPRMRCQKSEIYILSNIPWIQYKSIIMKIIYVHMFLYKKISRAFFGNNLLFKGRIQTLSDDFEYE